MKSEFARLTTINDEPVLLRGMRVLGHLRGLMFEANVEQHFSNPGDEHVEVVYTFPLPWEAVLLDVDIQLGELHLSGVVVEKKQAEARYEEALSEGNTAIMLEKNADRSYSLNLGNLAPGEDCRITLRYAQTLQFEQRGLRLLIPTVIAPRYGDPVRDGGMQPHQVAEHDLLADYPFDIELHLHGELCRARIASPSHSIRFAQDSEPSSREHLTLSLARRGALDRDFVLVLDELEHSSIAVLARDSVKTGFVALASFCPHLPDENANPLAIKILVDCSGSMAGDSLQAAKRSLQAIVHELGENDRFSLSRFGSMVEHRSRGLWHAGNASRTAAQRWISELEADLGGTEMHDALASTFKLAQTKPSDVLIVTDGEINAIDRTIELARISEHRLFVVGIGSSPAESHLRRLAESTGGACDFVTSSEAVEPAILRMFARLRSPRLTELTILWPEGAKPEWVSSLSSAVFDGDTVNAFAFFRQAPTGAARLMGTQTTNKPMVEIAKAEIPPVTESNDTLARVAATQRVKTLLESRLKRDETAAASIAVDYQLVSAQTNFLLFHQRAENERHSDMPELRTIRPMVPAGWAGFGSVDSLRSVPVLKAVATCIDFAPDVSAVPAVMRRSPKKQVDICSDASDDNFDIPAFLRKSTTDIDRSNPLLWMRSADYVGLTPLGLCEWLRKMEPANWPTSYQALRSIGVGTAVVEWLELVVAVSAALSEPKLIEAFLTVMAHPETYDVLTRGLKGRRRAPEMTRRLKTLLAGSTKQEQSAQEKSIAALLKEMDAETWPEQIFAMDTVNAQT